LPAKEELFSDVAHVSSRAQLMRHDFCLSEILGLFHTSLKSSLLMSALPVHLQILGVCVTIVHALILNRYFFPYTILFSMTLKG
jgi:hypothetical protein